MPYEYGVLSPIPSYNHQKEQTNTQPNGYYIHSGAMNSGLHPLHLLVSINPLNGLLWKRVK